MIKAVDDATARELVARLCKAELRVQGLPESAVQWGGDQRAKDGGVDVYVDCPKPLSSPDFVPTPRTVIQVKAEKFTASKISPEMAPQGIIRPAIAELCESQGTYLIVSTKDDVSYKALKDRKSAIRSCFSDHGISPVVKTDFYDSRRVADWVEQHPAVATWLRLKIGQPMEGWRSYGPWAYKEQDIDAEYLIDDAVRVFTPGEKNEVSASQAIGQLRSDLTRSGSVRIVGLSGVGKTRLVQALFDFRVCSESPALSRENVIYTDISDEPDPTPKVMLERLLDQKSDVIVVVDNCGAETHAKLAELVQKRKNCRLKLLTIEYDIRDDIPEGTKCYRLEGVSRELLKKMLEQRYSNLSCNDADRIADFSDGNARVAFALASTAESGGAFSQLADGELFNRLFWQKKSVNEELRQCAEAASLLYSFDWDDSSSSGALALLAGFADVSLRTFRKNMMVLLRRGLLQARGQWRAVLPHAIANGLAKRTVEAEFGDELYNAFICNDSEWIARSFCRRLGYLHDCPQAVAISSRIFAVDGLFGDLKLLTDFQRQMFANLAPVVPEGALDAIERAIQSDDFLQTIPSFKDRFARTVRLIAYDPEYFDRAVSILKKAALLEPMTGNHNSIREMLVSLFYCYLSGTNAGPAQRQKIGRALLESDNKSEQELGFDLLEVGLKMSHFTTMHSCEFGAHRRDYGWQPRTIAEMRDWCIPWIEMTIYFGGNDEAVGRRARIALAHAFRGLWPWGHVGIYDVLIDAAKRFHAVDGWAEGWLAVREILRYDSKGLPLSSVEKLKQLEALLVPFDLLQKIRACVLARGHFAYDFEDLEILDADPGEKLSGSEMALRARMNAETLGAQAGKETELLIPLLPELCSGRGGNRYQFGQGVGRHCVDVLVLIRGVREVVKNLDRKDVNTLWLRGVINGWNGSDHDAVSAFLDHALEDDVWQTWFVELQCQVDIDIKGYERLMRGLDLDICPTIQFSYLGYNLQLLSVFQVMTMASKLALRSDGGMAQAIDMLEGVVRCAEDRDVSYREEFGFELREFFGKTDWSTLSDEGQGIRSYQVGQLMEFAVCTAKEDIDVSPVMDRILDVEDDEYIRYDDLRKSALMPVFKHFPRYALDMVCVPGDDGEFKKSRITTTDPLFDRPKMNPIDQVPKEEFVAWCNEEPELRYPFAAKVCQLFVPVGFDELPNAIAEVAIELMRAAPVPSVVVEVFIERFSPRCWSGSLAHLLESRLLLLDQLILKDDEVVCALVDAKKADLKKEIAGLRKSESSMERKQDSSFE